MGPDEELETADLIETESEPSQDAARKYGLTISLAVL